MGNGAGIENGGVPPNKFIKANMTQLTSAFNCYGRYMTEEKYENVKTLEILKPFSHPVIFMNSYLHLWFSHQYSFKSINSDFYIDMMISLCI